MPITLNGSTGITFPDGTTQSDGLTVPVPVSDGGTGATTASAARTALGTNDAANITTGTLSTARLGSGTANSTTFLRGDQTWATVSGGVTSLNGQTGVVTTTSVGDVGSVIEAIYGITAPAGGATAPFTNAGDTVAGSSLYYNLSGYEAGITQGNFQSAVAAFARGTSRQVSGSVPGAAYNSGGTSLTGTWRCLAKVRQYTFVTQTTKAGVITTYYWYTSLWVRVS